MKLLPLEVVDSQVTRYGVQVRLDRFWIDLSPVLPQLNEGILSDIFGHSRIAHFKVDVVANRNIELIEQRLVVGGREGFVCIGIGQGPFHCSLTQERKIRGHPTPKEINTGKCKQANEGVVLNLQPTQFKTRMQTGNFLVIGASGQIGIDLVLALRSKYGTSRVIAADIRPPHNAEVADGPFVQFNVMDKAACEKAIADHQISTVYHLAAMLSARAEQHPVAGWDLNMTSLLNLLELAREGAYKRLFWPSSIAVFGPSSPRHLTPQNALCEPTTVYGISKLAGERWCDYYHSKFGVDVRSLRYPGLIGHRSMPGGGTTDYAVDIFHQALETGKYSCFLEDDTALPMMHMDDAIAATIGITEAPNEEIKIRSSYNLAGISFTPGQLADAIRTHIPAFEIEYVPDFRQEIANSWPNSVDESHARRDWGWTPHYDLLGLTENMLTELEKKKPTR